ncbi:hypothetical protein GCM10023331_07070 [Algivirga pacifica]|uniref:Uncharacterized protein n=2 Tax=Algivirga pacifica TaxID=1162670 RepID=A0ABP9D294_9BACT
MYAKLEMQKKYRVQYESELQKIITSNPSDTIILVEKYDETCIDCPADDIQIFVKNKLISYQKDVSQKRYTKAYEILTKNLMDSTGYYHLDIIVLKKEISEGSEWNTNPKKYGSDDCFGGDKIIYTVLYPKRKTESMYIKCWELDLTQN